MTYPKITSSIMFLLVLALPLITYGQQIVTTTGGNGSGSGGSVTYTVGQVVNNFHNTGSGSITEGVQQPYEISVETDVEDINDLNLTVTAFPNPTADYLTISVKDFDSDNLSYKLFRIDGKIMKEGRIKSTETKIKMDELVSAVYLLKITKKSKNIKVFKIVKY